MKSRKSNKLTTAFVNFFVAATLASTIHSSFARADEISDPRIHGVAVLCSSDADLVCVALGLEAKIPYTKSVDQPTCERTRRVHPRPTVAFLDRPDQIFPCRIFGEGSSPLIDSTPSGELYYTTCGEANAINLKTLWSDPRRSLIYTSIRCE